MGCCSFSFIHLLSFEFAATARFTVQLPKTVTSCIQTICTFLPVTTACTYLSARMHDQYALRMHWAHTCLLSYKSETLWCCYGYELQPLVQTRLCVTAFDAQGHHNMKFMSNCKVSKDEFLMKQLQATLFPQLYSTQQKRHALRHADSDKAGMPQQTCQDLLGNKSWTDFFIAYQLTGVGIFKPKAFY